MRKKSKLLTYRCINRHKYASIHTLCNSLSIKRYSEEKMFAFVPVLSVQISTPAFFFPNSHSLRRLLSLLLRAKEARLPHSPISIHPSHSEISVAPSCAYD
ncbi:hypothetical protein CHARACLAT_001512 [Characodon lateralis]|uniref:Uncharacterized protein n=1 Tax=Characodon lateralis TaxID=208331 RepID=A0ABU7EG18_9TELE|nr:hypothetical protein [Characodon lateralis]